jgi:hypothetical protein
MGNLGTQFTAVGVGEYVLGNGVECWVVGFLNERKERVPHLFPKFTLEQRIAEYDLDPTDITGVLDMVLHEPYIPDPSDARNFDNDAAKKSGLTVAAARSLGRVKAGTAIPVHLGNAPDRATARQAHLARIADVKITIKINSGKGPGILSKGDTTDPLQTIVANHGVDPDRVKARAAYVESLIGDRAGKTVTPMLVTKPGGLPELNSTLQRPDLPYDSSVRRRGLSVALLDG